MCLQRLATNEVGPSADFAGDAFLAGKLLAHAAGKELGSLEKGISKLFNWGGLFGAFLPWVP